MIKQEGLPSSNLENAQSITSQNQFIDPTSLEIVRNEIESNASYSRYANRKYGFGKVLLIGVLEIVNLDCYLMEHCAWKTIS